MPLKTLLVSVGLAKPKGFVSEMVMDAFIGLVISLTGQTDEVSILFNIREGFKKKEKKKGISICAPFPNFKLQLPKA